ncbi:hypothetical protein C8J57DRAFT_1220761 [Mycena rebaudengoi]|nr:hypothetical protein C8J57DRAFT_1220761 [Mycena rebaudengoi]
MRRDLLIHQTLTATHDNAAAWSGLSSAVFYIWHQRAVSASLRGVVLALLYLGSVAILQVAMPNALLLQTATVSLSSQVATKGLPSYSYHASGLHSPSTYSTFARGSLNALPSILRGSSMEGLHEGTLYDVLDPNAGMGNVTVNATGFNITCRSLPAAHRISHTLHEYMQDRAVALDPAEEVIGVIPSTDAKSRKLLEIYTSIHKNSSTWVPFEAAEAAGSATGNHFVDEWACWYAAMPLSEFPRIRLPYVNYDPQDLQVLSYGDLHLIQKFNLADMDDSKGRSDVSLHDLENALSTIVAGMFWALGHAKPFHGSIIEGIEPNQKLFILLALLSLQYSLFHWHGIPSDGEDVVIMDTGILHTIWIYRIHPELNRLLE